MQPTVEVHGGNGFRRVMDDVELQMAVARLMRSLTSLGDTQARLGATLEHGLSEMRRCIYDLEVVAGSTAARADTGGR